jgi:hypothetical protein
VIAYSIKKLTFKGNKFLGVKGGWHSFGLQTATISGNSGQKLYSNAFELQEGENFANKDITIDGNKFYDWRQFGASNRFGFSLAGGTNYVVTNNELVAYGATLKDCIQRTDIPINENSWGVEFTAQNSLFKLNKLCGFGWGLAAGHNSRADFVGPSTVTIANNSFYNMADSGITLWAAVGVGYEQKRFAPDGKTTYDVFPPPQEIERRWIAEQRSKNIQYVISWNTIVNPRNAGINGFNGMIDPEWVITPDGHVTQEWYPDANNNPQSSPDRRFQRHAINGITYLSKLQIDNNTISRANGAFSSDTSLTQFRALDLVPILVPKNLVVSANTLSVSGPKIGTGEQYKGVVLSYVALPDPIRPGTGETSILLSTTNFSGSTVGKLKISASGVKQGIGLTFDSHLADAAAGLTQTGNVFTNLLQNSVTLH